MIRRFDLFDQLTNGTINEVVVHAGKFHADDVFSVALCRTVNPDIKYSRVPRVSPEEKQNLNKLYADIGGGHYDHHQPNAEYRPEDEGGVKYAAFGLLWRDLGTTILESEKSAQNFDKNFVQIIDETDNTGVANILSTQVAMFSPTWNSPDQNFDAAFDQAVNWATDILLRAFDNIRSTNEAEAYIVDAANKALIEGHKNIIILDTFAPYNDTLIAINSERAEVDKVMFVVYPSIRDKGSFNAMTVKVSPNSQKDICQFPVEWAGKSDFSDTDFPELTFCHMSRFIISGKSLPEVVNACVYAIERKED